MYRAVTVTKHFWSLRNSVSLLIYQFLMLRNDYFKAAGRTGNTFLGPRKASVCFIAVLQVYKTIVIKRPINQQRK